MPSSRIVVILVVLLSGALSGGACSKQPAATPASNVAPAASAPALPPAMPAHSTASPAPPAASPAAPEAASPGAAPSAARGAVRTATGVVVETMDAADYTYVRLDTGLEKFWAATSRMKVKVGDRLVVPLEMPVRDFHSEKLGRDFALIYFASSVSRDGGARAAVATAGRQVVPAAQAMPGAQATMPAGQAMPPGHPPIRTGAAAAPIEVTESIPPAPGGHSIADVWAQRATLAGKTVVVRGKVVKFLSGIMGRNWIHLQDGTGDAKGGTNDITVTTTADASPGDVVTATGTLAVDKDFGAGYRYGAIVEGATLSK